MGITHGLNMEMGSMIRKITMHDFLKRRVEKRRKILCTSIDELFKAGQPMLRWN
jgi:hypothetical protein